MSRVSGYYWVKFDSNLEWVTAYFGGDDNPARFPWDTDGEIHPESVLYEIDERRILTPDEQRCEWLVNREIRKGLRNL